jgi:hypothetical protein
MEDRYKACECQGIGKRSMSDLPKQLWTCDSMLERFVFHVHCQTLKALHPYWTMQDVVAVSSIGCMGNGTVKKHNPSALLRQRGLYGYGLVT